MLKTAFFGTPALAIPYLEALAASSEVKAVVTSPDKPAGRGYDVQAPAVKAAAQRLGLPVLQPVSVKTADFQGAFSRFDVDVAVVVAYGKLLPPSVLALARFGFLNVHFSLLPAYRGAAPIQWALIHGEAATGVSLFWLDQGMDTGPIFLQRRLTIDPHEDAEDLRRRLVPLGIEALREGLTALAEGRKLAVPQQGPPSLAPLLSKEDGRLDWRQSAVALHNRIRGLSPWPGAFCLVPHGNSSQRLKVLKARPQDAERGGAIGTIEAAESGRRLLVRCGEGALALLEVQPEGKKSMAADAWWAGARLENGVQLENP